MSCIIFVDGKNIMGNPMNGPSPSITDQAIRLSMFVEPIEVTIPWNHPGPPRNRCQECPHSVTQCLGTVVGMLGGCDTSHEAMLSMELTN